MRKEISIGILVLAAFILLFWGYHYLNNIKIFGKDVEYFAVYDGIQNMKEGDPVRVNGVQVGFVRRITFPLAPGDNRVLISFVMENNIPIPVNTQARIEGDLLGSNMINLRLSDHDQHYAIGDTLPTAVATSIQEEVSLQMMPVKRKAEDLMLQLDSVLAVIQYIFNPETRENIAQSFANIKNTIDNLENTTGELDDLIIREQGRFNAILTNVQSITGNLKDNNQQITQTFQNLQSISDTLAQARVGETMAQIHNTLHDLQEVTGRIQRGDGTLGKLLENDTLYYQLENSANNLDLLVEDIRINPQRYLHFSVFGRKTDKE